jgi:hypothetical protein
MKKLPEGVWIVLCNKGTADEYLSATTDATSIDDGETVGFYALVSLHKQKITSTLIPAKKLKR